MQGLRPLYRYFQFSGRSGRAEFWQFLALYIGALLLGFLLDLAFGESFPIFTAIVVVGLIVPAWAVTFRRLHDRNYSGWWYIVQASIGVFGFLLTRAANLNAYTATGDVLHGLSMAVLVAQFVLTIFMLVQLARVGDPGDNRFGPPPSYNDPAPTLGDIAVKLRAQAQPALQPTPPVTAAPATAATSRMAAAGDADPLLQIERLAKLRDAGTLTDEEFQVQKAALLSRL